MSVKRNKKENIGRYVFGAAFLLIGLLIAIGPQTIFAVCPREAGAKAMACYYTARTVLGTGIITAVLGIVYAIIEKSGLGISIAQLLLGIFVLLVPTVLVGVCKGEHMQCHSATLPALIILGVLLIAVSALSIAVYVIKIKKIRGN